MSFNEDDRLHLYILLVNQNEDRYKYIYIYHYRTNYNNEQHQQLCSVHYTIYIQSNYIRKEISKTKI